VPEYKHLMKKISSTDPKALFFFDQIQGNNYEKRILREFCEKWSQHKSVLCSKLDIVRKEREVLLNSFLSVRIARILQPAIYCMLFILPIILVAVFGSEYIFGIGIIFLIIIRAIWGKLTLLENAKRRAFRLSGEQGIAIQGRKAALENDLQSITKYYLKELDQICVKWSTYPTDWNDRRRRVKERDGYKCTKCDWPNGFKRRARTLHVHHKTAISSGGDHSMDNLITLCHVCHRKVDVRHRGVKKLPVKRRQFFSYYRRF
jgi:hypothetical protein